MIIQLGYTTFLKRYTMDLASPAFEHHQPIPQTYTCQGDDINPPSISITFPKETKSLVLIMDDPDAPER